jgi:peptide chain release factor 1
MFDKLDELEARYDELEQQLGQPEVVGDQHLYIKTAKEHSDLGSVVQAYRELKSAIEQIEQSKGLLNDPDEEMRELAKEELVGLREQKHSLTERIKVLLIPKDPWDEKDILLEIRAGTGGDEAALFAADLFRMYTRYAEQKRWKVEIISSNETGVGGFKEIICSISGKAVYSRLKFESGTHRVQRVPATEAQGRIHTSAVTVAILPEADPVDVELKDEDIRIDVYRSSGPGGQSVNTTDSAVRITHIETGLVVTCQDEKSQHKNRAQALKILSSRLLDQKIAEQQAERAAARRSQVGTGDRSGRIRTYNFPQSRVTDHRIGLTVHNLEGILAGELNEVLDALITYDQAEAMRGDSSE